MYGYATSSFFFKFNFQEPYNQQILHIGANKPLYKQNTPLRYFLQSLGNGKEGKVHIDLVFANMTEASVRHIVFHLSENSLGFMERTDVISMSITLEIMRTGSFPAIFHQFFAEKRMI